MVEVTMKFADLLAGKGIKEGMDIGLHLLFITGNSYMFKKFCITK